MEQQIKRKKVNPFPAVVIRMKNCVSETCLYNFNGDCFNQDLLLLDTEEGMCYSIKALEEEPIN